MPRRKQQRSPSSSSDASNEQSITTQFMGTDLNATLSTGKIAVFRPTLGQFAEFNELVDHIYTNFTESGIVKVIPPADWAGHQTNYAHIDNMPLEKPIRQNVIGGRGVYRLVPVIHHHKGKQVTNTIKRFRQYAKTHLPDDIDKLLTGSDNRPNEDVCQQIERKFWRNISYDSPLYGADTPGRLFDDSLDIWNVAKLPTALNAYSATIPGTNTPYLYVGMHKAMFAAHTEDQDLFSINYIHTGAPKQWYSIPPSEASRFEQVARTLFHTDARQCSEFLRHKHSMIAPHILKSHHINVKSVVQYAGEFMLTFPRAYHFGYNLAFNVAESLNFATPAWIPHGRTSIACKCRDDDSGEIDSVAIHMPTFEQQVFEWVEQQPDRSKQWHLSQLDKYGVKRVEWIFQCVCAKHSNVTNLDEWIDWPSGPMFRCPCCQALSHVYCYRRYQNRTPTHMHCQPYQPSADEQIAQCVSDMVSAVNKVWPLQAYQSCYVASQHPMYCHSCLPTHRFTKLTVLDDDNVVGTASRKYTHWRQRQIKYLTKLSNGGKPARHESATDSENESNSDDSDNDDVSDNDVEYTVQYAQVLSQAGKDVHQMIERDTLNPAMPTPDKQMKLFCMYQRNLFRRLLLHKRRYAPKPPALLTSAAVPVRQITAPPTTVVHTASVVPVQQQSSPVTSLPVFAANKPLQTGTSPVKRYSFGAAHPQPAKRQVLPAAYAQPPMYQPQYQQMSGYTFSTVPSAVTAQAPSVQTFNWHNNGQQFTQPMPHMQAYPHQQMMPHQHAAAPLPLHHQPFTNQHAAQPTRVPPTTSTQYVSLAQMQQQANRQPIHIN